MKEAPGLVKRGEKWHINLMVNGIRVRQSTDTDDLKTALNILAKVRSQVVEGQYFKKPQGDNRLFCEMMNRFIKEHRYYRGRRISDNTRESYKYSLKHLLPVFADMSLSKITPERIRRYQEERENEGSSPASINRETALLSVAFNTAVKKWKWIDKNPCANIDNLPESGNRVRYLTEEEIENLYAHLPERLKPIVTVARFTGLRLSNILGLTWDKVDLFRKVLIVDAPDTKNKEPLGLPMNETVFSVFKDLNKVRHLRTNLVFPSRRGLKRDRNEISEKFRKARKKAGLNDFRFHDLRHCFGSSLVQRGVDIYSVAELMGHKSVRMTQKYAHLSPEKLRADISVLDIPIDTNLPQRKGVKK